MRLYVYLSWMCLGEGPLQRFVLRIFKSRLFLGLPASGTIATAVEQTSSLQTATRPISILGSCYSAFASLAMMRRERFWNMMHDMKSLVQIMEAAPGEQAWVAGTRKSILRFAAGNLMLWLATVGSALVGAVLHPERVVPSWPFVPLAGTLGFYIARLSYIVSVFVITVPIGFVVTSLGCVTATATGLHHGLAQSLDTATSPEKVRDVVKVHQQLRHITVDLTDLCADNLGHILVSSFCHSLIAILQVLANDTTSFTFAQLLRVVIVFLQLSHLSQELSDASLVLQTAAYQAASGGSVSLSEARALHLAMLTSSRQPALTCKGLGRLSLANAGKAFNHLYSVVNMLGPKVRGP
ncbi:Odorant receptor 13 [Frankliniella occidentalis]|nr:Odorant receptor 13 [Frankliniella occidentalis]